MHLFAVDLAGILIKLLRQCHLYHIYSNNVAKKKTENKISIVSNTTNCHVKLIKLKRNKRIPNKNYFCLFSFILSYCAYYIFSKKYSVAKETRHSSLYRHGNVAILFLLESE